MPQSVLLIISIIVCLLFGMSRKYYIGKFSGGVKQVNFFNAIVAIFAIVTFLIWGGFGQASYFTVLSALAFGTFTALQYLFVFKAMAVGSWAYTSVITSLSTLIPAVSGWLFWDELVSWPQIVGMALMVVCFVFSVDLKKGSNTAQGKSKKKFILWLVYALVAFFTTGGIGVMQKVHSTSAYAAEKNAFLIIAFLFSFVFAGSIYAICLIRERKKQQVLAQTPKETVSRETQQATGKVEKSKKYYGWKTLIFIVVGGVFVALNNKLNLQLSGEMDSAVFFPLVNGTNLILTTIVSVVLFKEKFKKLQWIGLIAGIVAVIMLCNPFA